MPKRFAKFVLFLGDLAFLHLALFLTLVVRYPRSLWRENWQNHWPSFLIIFAVWLLLFYLNGLYDLNLKASGRKFFRLTINAALISALFSIIYFYINVNSSIAPRTNLAIFIAFFLVLFLLWRGLYQFLARLVAPPSNLALIGANGRANEILKELRLNPGAGYQTALIFQSPEDLENLAASVKEKDIRAIVIADDFGQSEKMRAALFNCLSYQINFFNYPDFYELLSGKIPVEAIGQNWFLENLREGRKSYFNFFKHGLDFCLALAALLVSLPVWPFIALGVKLSGRGPVFFRQTRLGKNGVPFKIIKFRSMRTENNDQSPTAAADRRITPFGSFLRKTRLDELPQLINILKGEMSFIGPRPERPEIADGLKKQVPFYETRLLIRPGLTGWDQISGHYHSASPADSLKKLQYDLFYLKHRSLYLDLAIALKTLATMVGRQGR